MDRGLGQASVNINELVGDRNQLQKLGGKTQLVQNIERWSSGSLLGALYRQVITYLWE